MAHYRTHTPQIVLNLANRGQLPLISQWAIHLANTVVLWSDRYKARQVLGTMPLERLDDIGLTSKQAKEEARKPFWRS